MDQGLGIVSPGDPVHQYLMTCSLENRAVVDPGLQSLYRVFGRNVLSMCQVLCLLHSG